MPELPEVETVVRDLRPLVVGRTVVELQLGTLKLRKPWLPAWTKGLPGKSFASVGRRGKWILGQFDDASVLLVHLGMTGQFTVNAAADARPDHTHFVFTLSDGNELRYRDVRRFGSVEWFRTAGEVETALGEKLGPEPVDIPGKPFRDAVMGSARTLKAILLDQGIVAGVGNIYADESLHRSKLHPETRGKDLTAAECDRLRKAIEVVIAKAIDSRGSTIRDYIGGSGLKGGYQNEFVAYGRTGEPCPRCEYPIEMVRVAGRSSHFCPRCQSVT